MSVQSLSKFLTIELWRAYEAARKGKRNTIDEHRFELNDMENIVALRESIIHHHYQPSRGVTFVVHDPVVREIVAAPFRDRVVHHFLYNLCADWWDRRFIVDSYSCRKNKGVLFGQQRLEQHIRRTTKNFTQPAFSVSLDIQSYFISLNHKKIYERIVWGLDHQFRLDTPLDQLPPNYLQKNGILCHPFDRERLYHLAKFLWHQVIYDDPMRGIIIRGSKADWAALPPHKSLFNRKPGRGIVIGNLTSQLVSNIFLDQLDRFITHDLGYKHYGRYVDDFYIIVPLEQREQLIRDIKVIESYLRDDLDLTLHPHKRRKQLVSKGVPFVGAVAYPGFIVPGHRAKRKAYQAAYNFATNGTGDLEGIISREGTLLHINSRRFFRNLFDSFGWEFDWNEPAPRQASFRLKASTPPSQPPTSPKSPAKSPRHRSHKISDQQATLF